MEFKVAIPSSVKKDIEEIISYYNTDRPQYSEKILKHYLIKLFPNRDRVVPELLEYSINQYRELIESY